MTENNSKTDIQLSTLKTVLSMVDTRQRNIENFLAKKADDMHFGRITERQYEMRCFQFLNGLHELDKLEDQIIALMKEIESKHEEELLTYFQE